MRTRVLALLVLVLAGWLTCAPAVAVAGAIEATETVEIVEEAQECEEATPRVALEKRRTPARRGDRPAPIEHGGDGAAKRMSRRTPAQARAPGSYRPPLRP